MLKIKNKIDEIINDFKEGCSSIEINKKYGAFGEFVLLTYVTDQFLLLKYFFLGMKRRWNMI